MAFAVKENKTFNPVYVDMFCAQVVMFYAQASDNLLKQLGWIG
jgi:hypothetical protein